MKNDLVFTLELMNSDFTGPAPSTTFPFGTRIPIRAKVEQPELAPVWIYLQYCMLANTPNLTQASQLHMLISDAGCLTESKEGSATFLPRREPSEICLHFQAFKFALGEQVFLHCDMTASDLQNFSVDKKACQYLQSQNRWELLDDPTQSYFCSCCDFTCVHQPDFNSGISTQQVLGPFTMVDSQPNASDKYMFWPTEQGLGGVPVWVVALTVCLVLILIVGVIATSYYLCFWRGGRLGYRPSRELLNKY
ncbi:zona pellucida sperm-binding protein 3-like [Neoarius graeffei]|uniref:zona pellucida sperm-binding protein 3-like n=1 Tax=Neoarius graeffei TaxID=443677 RepID=UPI00298CA2B3|nr:zona pellucida sperm-binding protein 3-like [Neoarius graeffei]